MFFNPITSLSFHAAPNFTNHYNTFGLRVIHKKLNRIAGGSSDNRIATYTNGGGLSQAGFGELVNSFVSEGAGTAYNTHHTFFMYKSGHNTNFGFIGGDDTRTIWPD
ncbi:hypothetical protein DSECCO2_593690 [anaerobic digester metagenome]